MLASMSSEAVQPPVPAPEDTPEALAADIEAIGRIASVPAILRLVCEITGMGFAAVARVTDGTWTACALRDGIGFGLQVGGQLDLHTTLCHEARLSRSTIAFSQASLDPVYKDHHTPRIYGIESYFSTPIALKDGTYFGNLCAIDPSPGRVSDPRTIEQLELFAELIAVHLQNDERFHASERARLDEMEASALREHFIAVLGHDLRNPLSALAASTELLRRGAPEPATIKATDIMRASVRRMSALIDDVMDLARARLGGGIGVRIELVSDFKSALQQVATEIRAAHPDARIVDEIDLARPVRCDVGRIQQLVSNLLGNAISHGDTTRPITLAAHEDDGWLSLRVTNAGPSIPADVLCRVFEPYWRPTSGERGGGLGLGLYICQQIAKAHRGTMAVTSADESTTFEARLPLVA